MKKNMMWIFVFILLSAVVFASPPTIDFFNQTPADITSLNAVNGIQVIYNVTDTIPFNTSFYYFLNDTGWIYENGTNLYINFTLLNETPTINGDFRIYNLEDSDVYPATYNLNERMDITPHSIYLLGSATTYGKIELLNVSNSHKYNYVELMVNYSGTLPSSVLSVYYCNSSYVAGIVTSSVNCILLQTLPINSTFSDNDSNYSSHMKISFPINTTSGTVGTVKVTSRSYIVFGGWNWNAWYVNITTRQNASQTSTNSGTAWTSQNYTFDAHMHQFKDNDSFEYYLCANDSISGNCSEIKQDLMQLAGLPPTSAVILNPVSAIYSGIINITHTIGFSPNDYPIMYGMDLLNSGFGLVTQISITQNATDYLWNSTIVPDGNYIVKLSSCDNMSQCSYSYGDVFTIKNGAYSPLIFIGGIVEFINDTYAAVFNYSFIDYPYVRTNTTNRFDFFYVFNGSEIIDADVHFYIANTSQSLGHSSVYNSYPVWIFFNASESGDYSWNATAQRSGYTNNNLSGTLIVRDYDKIKITLWQECTWYQFWCGWFNPGNQANYKNRFGYVFATPIPDDRMGRANYSWHNQLQPLKDLATWGNRKFLDNLTNLYRLENKAFSAPYVNGEAVLFLPSNTTYALEFIAAKMAWDSPTGYGYGYYSKKYTEQLMLDGIKPIAGLDYNLEYLVTNYEMHRTSIWTFWIIFGAIMMLLLIFAAFIIAFDPAKGLIMLMIVVLLSPLLWLALKLIFWVISL